MSLTAEQITVRLGGLTPIDDASIGVERGERVGLIGPNGAGKTTLLNAITGFMRPSSGQIIVDDTDVTDWASHRRARYGLARTFQRIHLFRGLSVRENIELASLSAGSNRREARRQCDHVMDALDLGAVAANDAGLLPHGFAQRVAFARATVARPKYLVLDEPAAGLGDDETDGMTELIRALSNDGTGVVVVEHDLRFIESVCGRVYALAEGRLCFDGSVEDVFNDHTVQISYLGTSERAAVGRSRVSDG